MTRDEKDLLLKDLCARLPYGVILNCCGIIGEKLKCIDEHGLINHDYDIDEVIPHLFPLSSMTEEQRNEYCFLHSIIFSCFEDGLAEAIAKLQDWLNKNHFDFRGLIEQGLAIDATGLNIY